MNISGLIRNLVGDLTASDSKVLELKVGQVVKGLVLQLLGDQEALINIGGVQVRAKLETPLKQGDVTLLQVQPESNSGQILLKPLASSDVMIADESMGELLKGFQLKDISQNRQMIQQMQQGGVPLTKETVQAFTALQSAIPEGVSKEEFNQAAVLAFKRALPLTPETVHALRQATSGPPMGDVLEKLEQQAAALLKDQPALKSADTLSQVVSVLKELRSTAAAVWTSRPSEAPAAPGAPAPAAATAAPQQQQPPGSGAPAPAAPSGPPQTSGGSAAAPAAPAPAAAAPAAASPASAAPRAEGAPAASAQPAAVSTPAPQRAGEGLAQARSAEPGADGEPPVAGSPVKAASSAEGTTPKAQPQPQGEAAAGEKQAADTDPNWISRLLKTVGVDHEHQLAKLTEKPELLLRSSREDMVLSSLLTEPAADGSQKPAADTLKSLLMQMSSANDLPPALKESAQQALQQITGQQLLLTNDRASMFSHMTLFIPFMDGSGQQSAAVHIQSRKGKRGEIDTNNCRLLFDLQMKVMGSTLVDVQVVNRIVSLQIHNDHPFIADLMENSRDEIAAALQKVGYQFLSLKTSPFPELSVPKESEPSKAGGAETGRLDPKSLYQPKAYKGVDFRV